MPKFTDARIRNAARRLADLFWERQTGQTPAPHGPRSDEWKALRAKITEILTDERDRIDWRE